MGLVGRWQNPVTSPMRKKHPASNMSPAVKEDRFHYAMACRSTAPASCWSVLVVQRRELRQFDEAKKSLSSSPRHPDGGDPPVPAERPVRSIVKRAFALCRPLRGGDRRGLDGRQPAADGAGV
ncbi:hypothetical protein MJ575_23975 [Klebsiella pneumoniae]|nr:hypothetical protein MJ575_23975 [Klebsiella pneumoniae]